MEDTTPLRERLEDLERKFRRLEEEWTEMYGKIRTLQMRVAKQVQRLDADSSLEEPTEGKGDEVTGASPSAGVFSSLSPRAQKIQREILARRARGATQGGE